MTRVLLLGKHRLGLEGLASLLGQSDDVHVAGSGTALDDLPAHADGADVLVVNAAGTPASWVHRTMSEAAKRLPTTKVLVLVEDSDDPAFFAGIDAGAAGCLLLSSDAQGLCEAVRGLARDGFSLGPELTRRLLERLRTGETGPVAAALTSRELEILREVASGSTNMVTGERLRISESTVKNHLYSIYRKLDVGSRSQAIAEAYRRGLLEHP